MRRGRAVLLGLAATLCACLAPAAQGPEAGTAEPAAEEAREVGSLEELRELIREGSLGEVQAVVSETEEIVDPLAGAPDGSNRLPTLGIPSSATLPELELVGMPALEVIDLPSSGSSPGRGPRPGPEDFDQNPFLRFGERIVIGRDGRITKPFPLQEGRGRKLLQLLTLTSGIPITYTIASEDDEPLPEPDQPLGPGEARVVLLEKWDFEQYQNFSPGPQAAPTAASKLIIADWMVVTAEEAVLAEIQGFVELFAGSVPQIEVEARIVEVTTTDELDYGVRGLGGDTVGIDFPEGTAVDSFGFGVPNITDANEALLTIGTILDGVAINAVLEAIQTWENVNITTRPKIAVREGGVAEIINTQEVPFFNFGGLNSGSETFNATLSFKEVGIKLYVSPRVVGTSTLALNLFVEASQVVGTAIAFFDAEGNQFSSPLIAKRQARTVVYLEPGQALVIGGLESSRDVDSERKVPILGDLPLLGLLFRSDFTRRERTNVLFIIRPRILQGGDFNQDF